MKKVMIFVLAALFASLGLFAIACDDDDDDGDADNVGACEDWLASMECGDYDFSEVVDCSAYADYPCDISDYFDCLAENGSCDEDTGVYDSSGWGDCADLASCE